MDYLKDNAWRLTFSQRVGIFFLLFSLFGIEIYLNFNQKEQEQLAQLDIDYFQKFEKKIEESIASNQFTPKNQFKNNSRFISDSIKAFNPNDLPKQGWEKLGFTSKQAEVIMKYKQMLGGTFESKEQIKKCFVVSDEVYAVLEPKILLPEKSKSDYKLEKSQTSKKVNYKRFNPNSFEEKDWISIGFTPKQAEVILKYKRIVGGEFQSKEQLKKCFVISDEKFKEMQSFIDLPDVVEKSYTKSEENKTEVRDVTKEQKYTPKIEISEKFNPNTLDHEGWMKLGFTEKQAQTILNFKRSLGGKFKDGKMLSRSYVISEEKFKEMEPFLVFD